MKTSCKPPKAIAFVRAVAMVVFLVLAGLEIVDEIRSFLAADGPRYFASHPHRLLYVVEIALVAGGVVLVFSKFSSRMRHALGLIMVGGLAVATTCFLGVLINGYIKLPITPLETGMGGAMFFQMLAFLLAALLFWYEFAARWWQTTPPSKSNE